MFIIKQQLSFENVTNNTDRSNDLTSKEKRTATVGTIFMRTVGKNCYSLIEYPGIIVKLFEIKEDVET